MKILNHFKNPFSLKDFVCGKLILMVALACELTAYLMAEGYIQAAPKVINGLTVAGVILMFIYLVSDGLRKKYALYSNKWGESAFAGAQESGDAGQAGQI